MFNLDTSLSDGLLLWMLGTCASAVVTRSVATGVLAAVILSAWGLTPDQWERAFALFGNAAEPVFNHQIIAATFAGLLLAWFLRSRAIAWITLLAQTLWILMESNTYVFGLTLWGFTLFGGYLWIRSNWQLMEAPFKYLGICSGLLGILTLTNAHMSLSSHAWTMNHTGLLCSALVTLSAVAYMVPKFRQEAFASLLLIGYMLVFWNSPHEMTRVAAYNFMLVLSILALAFSGLRSLQSPGVVNTAIVFAVLDIISRYFDFFFTMMDRSLFFIIGGIVLMVAGAFAEQSRRHLLGGEWNGGFPARP